MLRRQEKINNFNPRSPHGERPAGGFLWARQSDFNPRSPHGERPHRRLTASPAPHFNPRSPHGERQRGTVRCVLHDDFNPRSPHGERQEKGVQALPPRHFNPRSPHGERPVQRHAIIWRWTDFNPRSPHGERPQGQGLVSPACKFQSTLPARGATPREICEPVPVPISIHAPRTGSDVRRVRLPCAGRAYFNPRSPHGERRFRPEPVAPTQDISIHAPRTGSDQIKTGTRPERTDFNPRSPHGERRHVRR